MADTTQDARPANAKTGLAELHILDNLTDGIIVIGSSGTIRRLNSAATQILGLPSEKLIGRKFANCFFDNPENDTFAQTVLDAIYSKDKLSESIVTYVTNGKTKHLRMYVSIIHSEGGSFGYILVLSDLSALIELKDAVQDMARISNLNTQLMLRNELLQKTFGMFLSDEVVRELIEQPQGPVLGGTNQYITVMMSDLRGFTALSEQMSAEDLIAMLNHYLAEMTTVIQHWGGTIIEFIGDGIMTIFGAPLKNDHHAVDAVCAAIEMQAVMEKVNSWNEERGYPWLEMGIGINTGSMIVGNVGSNKRMKYGVVGSNVNLCGRIESYTIGGQILISPETRRAISAPLKIEREMTVSPKGVANDIVLSHITGIGEPYNLFIKIRNDPLKELASPVAVCFSMVIGKHAEDKIHYGGFTAIGRDSAILQTEAPLKIYDNIRVQAGGKLLCKVLDDQSGSYMLQFTSIPSGFASWIKAVQKSG